MIYYLLLVVTCLIKVKSYNGPALGPGNYFYSGPSLAQPLEISSSNGNLDIELIVDTYNFKSFISFTTRAYFYKGQPMIPAPTVRVKPGDNLNFKITNKLTGNFSPMTGMNMNTFHGENVTNLHTHGLHIDPAIDTVFRQIYPGNSWTYNYSIPADHAPGLHWYHAHKHGSSALQVMGGLFGTLYVDPSDPSLLPSELSTWPRVLLQLSHFSVTRANTLNDPFTVRTYADLVKLGKDTLPPNFSFANSNYQDIYFTNGQFQPYYNMTAGQNIIFDILNANGDSILEIQVMSNIGGGKLCDMTLLAIDGVYLSNPRKITFFALAPSSRASIVVMCSTSGTYYLQTYADQSSRGNFVDNEVRFNQNLLTLYVSASSSNMQSSNPLSIALSKIKRPDYLNDLLNYDVKYIWEISVDQTLAGRDLAWIGMGKDCTITAFGRAEDSANYDPRSNTNCKYLSYPGELGTTGQYRHIGIVNSVEQLNIWGRGASPHTIHIHTNHFQFYSHVSDKGNDLFSQMWGQKGDWRDTMPAIPGKVSIRYPLSKYTGEIVMHCHFLMHEDMGMMATFYSGNNFCNFPDTCKVDKSAPSTDSNNSNNSNSSTGSTPSSNTGIVPPSSLTLIPSSNDSSKISCLFSFVLLISFLFI